MYIPSSGSIVSVKLRMSSGFGKSVRMVLPRESSDRSVGDQRRFGGGGRGGGGEREGKSG